MPVKANMLPGISKGTRPRWVMLHPADMSTAIPIRNPPVNERIICPLAGLLMVKFPEESAATKEPMIVPTPYMAAM